MEDTGEEVPSEDVPSEDTSFAQGVDRSVGDLSLLGEDPGGDVVGGEPVEGETAIGDAAGYEGHTVPDLGGDRQSHQVPAPASAPARVVGGVLIAGAVVVIVGGALRRRSVPVLSRRR